MSLLIRGTEGITFPDTSLQAVAAGLPHCGRLTYSTTTALEFRPLYGDKIQVNGKIYSIPPGGIAGLNIAVPVFVNGVSQTLPGDDTFFVYVFDNAGVLTADFCSGVGGLHSTSSTPGNVGVEILTGNDTRTLIGMARTGTGPRFYWDSSIKFVASWFNRRNVSIIGPHTNNQSCGQTSGVTLNGQTYFMNWADEACLAGLSGYGRCDTAGALTAWVGLDSIQNLTGSQIVDMAHPGYWHQFGMGGSFNIAEGWHVATPCVAVSNGTALFGLQCTVMTRI